MTEFEEKLIEILSSIDASLRILADTVQEAAAWSREDD